MSRVLVNGIGGAAGSGMARRLVKDGYDVRGIDVLGNAKVSATVLGDIIDKIDYRWKSLQDISREDMDGCDVVLNFSAQADVPMGFTSPLHTVENNVMSVCYALEAARHARGLKKFIHASSGNVVQRPISLPIGADHPVNPANPYGASKGAQELIVTAWNRAFGVPTAIFRNGIIYGPGMRRDIFIYLWLRNIIQGRPCMLEGGGQTRDPTYWSDTEDAWMLGVEAEPETVVGQTFQVSFGEEWTVRRILQECMDACGKQTEVVEGPYRPGEEGMREWFDISKAKERLGFSPKVPLAEGLRKTVAWMKTLSSL